MTQVLETETHVIPTPLGSACTQRLTIGVKRRHSVLAGCLATATHFAFTIDAANAQQRPLQPQVSEAKAGKIVQPAAPARKWYGYQVLAADAVWITAVAVSEEPLVLLAYPFTGVVAHALNGRAEAAVGSFALRLFLPLTLGAMGATGGDGWAGAGLAIVGAGSAILVDGLALSWGTAAESAGAGTAIAPVVVLNRGFHSVGIRGVF